MKTAPSPLHVWILLLVAGVAASAVLMQFDPVRVHLGQRREELPKKLEKEAKKSTTEKSGGAGPARSPHTDIVFFGNSLFQAALPVDDADLSSLLSRIATRHGRQKPVRVVNLSADGRSAWDLARRSEQILNLNPKVIVIQPEMIVRRNVEREKERWFGKDEWQRMKNWVLYARKPMMIPIVSTAPSDRKEDDQLKESLSSPAQVDIGILRNTKEEESEEARLRRAEQYWSGQTISASNSEFARGSAFVQRAQERGIPVLVVETPVSETAVRLATQEYLDQRVVAVQEILGPQDEYLRFPEYLPDDNFTDYSHVNRKGQKAFLQWLAPFLGRRLAKED